MIVTDCMRGQNGPHVKTVEPKTLLDKLLLRLNRLPTSMTCSLCSIDPETAQWILDNLNHPNNRSKKAYRIALMADDMRNGYWRATHQALITPRTRLGCVNLANTCYPVWWTPRSPTRRPSRCGIS